MEKIWMRVRVTSVQGGQQEFAVVSNPGQYPGLRACAVDSSAYYDWSVFERGLTSGRAASVEREMTPDCDFWAYEELRQASK